MAYMNDDVMIVGERHAFLTAGDGRRRPNTYANDVKSNTSYVQTLNEMFPSGTSYVEEGRSGPAHDPVFRIGVHVNGMKFVGTSRTKQKARHEAARQAVNYFESESSAPMYWPPDGPQPYGESAFADSPYESRFRHRFDHYHRYQPYYRNHSQHDTPYSRPADDHQLFSRPPFDDFRQDFNASPDTQVSTSGADTTTALKTTPVDEPNISANKGSKKYDFTADDCSDDFVEFNDNKAEDESMDTKTESAPTEPQVATNRNERIILRVTGGDTSGNQNPVSLIHELQPNATWVCTELHAGPKSHSSTFEMRLLLPLANQCYTGSGRTKKLAKADAASKALLQMYNISLSVNTDANSGQIKHNNTVTIAQEPLVLKQDIADRIGRQVMTKCGEIWEKLVDLKKWTVLSAIVLTDETNAEFVDVICMTSGTKCVKGDSLSMNGSALNDCHAEVLARRAFVSYIYNQIESLVDNSYEDKPEFIIEKRPDGYGFRLKKNIKVNLFISTAPCGDSRVFSPKEETEGDAHPNRQTRGLLRAKIEGGEGTIPVKRDAILTWDGILQGHQRLQFMSCSDKIAVWNVVGIQGALLSHILEPIYLESVVLASLFNYEHLIRAVHSRLNLNYDSNSLKDMPTHYALNKSKVAKCQLRDDITRQLTKAPNYALNWMKGDDTPEVISTESGRLHGTDTGSSRLAKRTLFGRFCALLGRNTCTLPTCSLGSNIPVIYRDGKTSAHEYQRAKTLCMQAFQEQNLGQWIQVPTEVDLFRL